MEHIQLDCSQMTDRASAHAYLARALDFPDWYGSNLDALYDMLTGHIPPMKLELLHPWELEVMGEYGHSLLDTMQDAAIDNPDLELILGE